MADSPAIGAIGATNSTAQYTSAPHPIDVTPTFAPAKTVPAKTQDDQANLSPAAQATLLQQSGLSVSEIADELGISVDTVMGDLGIAIANPQTKAATA